MKMKFRSIAYVVLLFFLGTAACNTKGDSKVSSSETTSSSDILKVMTYNTHHASPPSKNDVTVIDLPAIAEVINRVKPDLVALQELDVNNTRSGVKVNQAKILADMTGMEYHFTRAIFYKGGKYGNAVLSRFPIEDTLSFHLPIVEGAKEEHRALSMIKVRLGADETLWFGSTHLALSKPSRLLQAHKIVENLQSMNGPIIIGGDFNATPESETLQILDSTFTRSCTMDCAFTIPETHPTRKIDYIIYRPADSFEIRKQEVIPERYASDHLPVVTYFVRK